VARPKQAAAKASRSYRRTSRRTKEIGDWAEQFVHDWLREHLSEDERSTIDWLARRGETPGWDISYTTRDGQEIAVEVKATVSARVSVIEVTANEWQAAEQRGPEYIVAIVTGAMSPHPRIALLRDPVHTAESAGIVVAPSSYRLVWTLDQ
jgi:poly-beta-hydroxyalkanoate depolymerase